MKADTTEIIGKTITGVITSPVAPGRRPGVVMLQFSDGSCFEFVSAAAMKNLHGQMAAQFAANHDRLVPENPVSQLTFHDV